MQDTHINTENVKVTLRKSLLNLFQKQLNAEMENLSCHYFAHNLIKNYNKPDHAVSSFHSHPTWQDEYWEKHWESDLLAHKVFQAAETDGFAVSSWDFVDPNNDVMNRRKTVCNLHDGVHYTFRHDDGTLENYSFGWKKVKGNEMGFDKLLKLTEVVSAFRDAHLKLFSEPTPQSSDEK